MEARQDGGLRERSKARRREAIIRAALELFADRGYDATTIADIAAAAEVAPRTVTMYFPSKQDIAMARFGQSVDELTDATARRPGRERDGHPHPVAAGRRVGRRGTQGPVRAHVRG